MDTYIETYPDNFFTAENTVDYFKSSGEVVSRERCSNIIADSSYRLGRFDFYYQWWTIPTLTQIHDLYGRIDEALEPLGVWYKVVHSPAFEIEEKDVTDEDAAETLEASRVEAEAGRRYWARFEVFTDAADAYRFRLKAPNNKIIAVSEAYTTKDGALGGIESVKKNAAVSDRFEVYDDKAGMCRFRLRAPNKEIIAASQRYKTKQGCLNGVESVKLNAPRAETIDLTEL
ncbi:DUF1508 domain-containing protein [Candidatus Bathyarchaeota archaeon]|nr:DUF1508 domain-containing protein [Candidatus Bathyarchaeota archaeon]